MKRIIIQKIKVKGTRGHKYILICNQCKKTFQLGGNNFNKGRGFFCSKQCRGYNNEWKKKISNSLKQGFKNGRIHPKGMLGKTAWNKDKVSPRWKGKNNPNWNNGSSFEEYGKRFTKKLKEKIRNRDNNTCQICNGKSKIKLDVHHIDYNKKNNNPKNLISLCHRCHMKTNPKKNRDYYRKALNSKITMIYAEHQLYKKLVKNEIKNSFS